MRVMCRRWSVIPISVFSSEGRLLLGKSFTSYTYDKYAYEEACRESVLDKRTYTLCDSLTATDASYLVEPVDGLWLLAIDGEFIFQKK